MKYVLNCPACTFPQINKTGFQVRDGSQEVVERVKKKKKEKENLPSIWAQDLYPQSLRKPNKRRMHFSSLSHPVNCNCGRVPTHFHVGTESVFHQRVRSLVFSIPQR